MQRLGYEVWAVNTVEFSNHTGYGAWTGRILGADLAAELVGGVVQIARPGACEAILSGYLGSAGAGKVIADSVRLIRTKSKDAVYCCDPVMGDTGRGFYVSDDIPGIFKNELCPLADIITPNHFELEALTGMDTKDISGARRAIDVLHKKGPSVILVTSYQEEKNPPASPREISMLASDNSGMYRITTPLLALGANTAGTGDLTAAVFLSRYLETGNIRTALELCASSVFGILEKSFQADENGASGAELPFELRIIDAQEELVLPTSIFRAEKL